MILVILKNIRVGGNPMRIDGEIPVFILRRCGARARDRRTAVEAAEKVHHRRGSVRCRRGEKMKVDRENFHSV